MAILDVKVASQAHPIPNPRSQQKVKLQTIYAPRNLEDKPKDDLTGLNYVYDMENVQGSKETVKQNIFTVTGQSVQNNTYYRYDTAGIDFIDKHEGPDANGIETNPSYDIIKLKQPKIKKIYQPLSYRPTMAGIWGADDIGSFFDQMGKNIGEAGKNNDKMWADFGKNMSKMLNSQGKALFDSFFGGMKPITTTWEEALPDYIANIHAFAYAPFLFGYGEGPKKPEESGIEKPSFNPLAAIGKGIAGAFTKGHVYPYWDPQFSGYNWKPWLYHGDNFTKGKADYSYENKVNLHRYNDIGFTRMTVDGLANGELTFNSRAFYLPNFAEDKDDTRHYGFYDMHTSNGTTSNGQVRYKQLAIKKTEDYYLQKYLLANSIGNTSPKLVINIQKAIENAKESGTSVEEAIESIGPTVISSHFNLLRYFPFSFDKNGKIILEKGDGTEFKVEDFYGINEESEEKIEESVEKAYKRQSTSNAAMTEKWDYGPYLLDNYMNYLKKIAPLSFKIRMPGTKNSGEEAKKSSSLSKRTQAKAFSPYAMLGKIGPDFLSHKFDAYFLWNMEKDLDEMFSEMKWLSDYERQILSKKGFAVRIGQVNIPKIINDDFQLQFLETEVHKVRSTKTINNQASFTLRLDQNLIWLDAVDAMAGHINTINEYVFGANKIHPYLQTIENIPKIGKIAGDPRRWRAVLKYISKSWPPGSRGLTYNIKDSELCLVVKAVHLSNWTDRIKQQETLPYFVFENVRILGLQDKISYGHDKSEPQSVTINFIFKRCYEVLHNLNKTDAYGFSDLMEGDLYLTDNQKRNNHSTAMIKIVNKRTAPEADSPSFKSSGGIDNDYKALPKILTMEEKGDNGQPDIEKLHLNWKEGLKDG